MDPYVAEIRLFPFNFAPKGWALCQGQMMSISQNTALYSLLGTTYGGDGRATFGLPNLMGCTTIGIGQGPALQNYALGQGGGETAVTLTTTTMPQHNHTLNAVAVDGAVAQSTANMLAMPKTGPLGHSINGDIFGPTPAHTPMAPTTLSLTGGGGAHNNMQPYLTLNYCIALQGVFPQRP